MFSNENKIDREELRSRLKQMTDAQLIRFGNATRQSILSGDKAHSLLAQLDEAHCEWHERYNQRHLIIGH